MGHVDEFLREKLEQDPNRELEASFILAGAPGTRQYGKLRKENIHEATDMSQSEGHSVLVKVEINKDELPIQPRPGASVTVDIHCGYAPVGYCWFHEAWEWVQKTLLF